MYTKILKKPLKSAIKIIAVEGSMDRIHGISALATNNPKQWH